MQWTSFRDSSRLRTFLRKAVAPLAVALLCLALPASHALGQTEARPAAQAAKAEPVSTETANWQKLLSSRHADKPGCFQAVYPSTTLQQVSCGNPRPEVVSSTSSKHVLHPLDEASSGDYSMRSQSVLYQVTGTLLAVENVTNVYGFGGSPGGPVPNEFSLQLNTDSNFPGTAPGSLCLASKNKSCHGWLQFVYDSGGAIFIQSWALNYGPGPASLPKGDNTGVNCGINNALYQLPITLLKVPDLAGAHLIGSVYKNTAGVSYAQLQFTVGGKYYVISTPDVSGAYGNWTNAEFNLVGNSGGDETVLNSGSLVSVALDRDNDLTTGSITCRGPNAGTTAESTNLTLMPCTVANGSGIRFKEGVVPVISSVSPAVGLVNGGAAVTIQALRTTPNNIPVLNGFNANALIVFGTTPAAGQNCNAAQCIVTAPPASGAQTVDITVANLFKDGTPGPSSTKAAADQYTYYAQLECNSPDPRARRRMQPAHCSTRSAARRRSTFPSTAISPRPEPPSPGRSTPTSITSSPHACPTLPTARNTSCPPPNRVPARRRSP